MNWSSASEGPRQLYFYKVYPKQRIHLDAIKKAAAARINLLRKMEDIDPAKKEADAISSFKEICTEEGVYIPHLTIQAGTGEVEAIQNDIVSHFMLQASYSRAREHSNWFISRELELMRMRIKCLKFENKQRDQVNRMFLDIVRQECSIETLEEEEFAHLAADLEAIYRSYRGGDTPTQYFKIPYFEVPNLVRRREILIKKGIGYVSPDQVEEIILSLHRQYLLRGLDLAARYHLISKDERLLSFLEELPFTNRDSDTSMFDIRDGNLSVANIEKYCKFSFPPCMQRIQYCMRDSHHLKHFARLQYTLFLKNAGMTNEECKKLFKQEFTRAGGKVTQDKFDKEYAYYIDHVYGLTGSRTDYTPYSCAYIINKNKPTSSQECHGCVFAHLTSDEFDRFLMRTGIGRDSREWNAISGEKRAFRYAAACREYFAALHEGVTTELKEKVGRHPNSYFYYSLKHHKDIEDIAGIDQKKPAQPVQQPKQ